MNIGFILLSICTLSTIGTFIVRSYAKKHLLDIPNLRSSHHSPTPTGGGLSIVICFLGAISTSYYYNQLNLSLFSPLLLSVFVAGIGFWDDHHAVSTKLRLLVHFAVSIGCIVLLNGMPLLVLADMNVEFGLYGYFIGLFFLVWLLNLFNFMDGIDGLAASESIFITGSLAFFLYAVDIQLSFISLCLSASSLGFLFWNWPSAKIFMGDVGSGFLGIVIGVLIIMASHQSAIFLSMGLILSAVFFTDATYTLLYRLTTGQKWYHAHCSHAYQHAAKQYGHLKVIQIVWIINLLWLLPLTAFTYLNPKLNLIALLFAYLPLIYLTKKFNAGMQAQ